SESLVTNSFFDTDIRQALSDVAAQTGVTIIVDESVMGYVTLDLLDVPLERALYLMLLPTGAVYKEVEPGVYLVSTMDPTAPAFDRIAEQRLVKLNYVTTDELLPLLSDEDQKFVNMQREGRMLLVRAPEPKLSELLETIATIDVPPVQVLIEALVIESTSEAVRQSGLAYTGAHLGVNVGEGLVSYTRAAAEVAGSLTALMKDNKTQLRASPRVVALDGEEAEIEVGTEEYYSLLTQTGGYYGGYARLEKVQATMKLTFKPRVNIEKREVTVEIQPDISDVAGKGAQGYPVVTVRRAKTKMRVHDGQVIVLGGLRNDQVHYAENKIPILCELPIIGSLFRSVRKEKEQREVIILIVPHILDENGQFEGELLGDLIGREAEEEESISPAEPESEPRGKGLREFFNIPPAGGGGH
ncbi:MAG: type II secretion system protein GspD, partial [Armatimonadetes bacterium]|nr:type II secretion system protein GspD [Armatimonadota bacterium]